jgi:SAM-dependent methyltransferase
MTENKLPYTQALQKQYTGVDELFTIEKHLKNYNKYLANRIFESYPKRGAVLEFGAGIGTLGRAFEKKFLFKPTCVEPDLLLQDLLKKSNFLCHGNVNESMGKFDFIYTSNVLEHIDDDSKAVHELYDLLNENGRLVVFVPAFQFLYSRFDARVGHHRRYEKSILLNLIEDAGFKVENLEFVDSLGFFAWLGAKIFSNKTNNNFSSKNLKIYDTIIFPLSIFLDGLGLKKLLGKNLLLVACKPAR